MKDILASYDDKIQILFRLPDVSVVVDLYD